MFPAPRSSGGLARHRATRCPQPLPVVKNAIGIFLTQRAHFCCRLSRPNPVLDLAVGYTLVPRVQPAVQVHDHTVELLLQNEALVPVARAVAHVDWQANARHSRHLPLHLPTHTQECIGYRRPQ